MSEVPLQGGPMLPGLALLYDPKAGRVLNFKLPLYTNRHLACSLGTCTEVSRKSGAPPPSPMGGSEEETVCYERGIPVAEIL